MKYLRTKKGKIIDLEGWQYDKYNECYFYERYRIQDNCYQHLIYKEDILERADTIEELGDTYVIVPKDKKCKPYTVDTLSVFDDIKDVLEFSDIYLSIWVDALLKPAAQLNDKGELVLL